MALMRDRKKFEEHRQRKLEMSEKKGQSSNFDNPNQLKFENGKTYRVRLLFDESDKRIDPKTGDHVPFVSKYSHSGKNSEGKWRFVTCLTTSQPKAYDDCPICKHNKKLWNSYKETSSARDKALYDMYKRKFNGFALCYVISDPTNPENNGHVKYFRFSIIQNRWFERKIDGIVDTYGKTDEEIQTEKSNIDFVDYQAYDTENGFDLIITVGKQGEYLNYDYDFARTTSDIGVDIDQLEAEIAEVDFDRHVTSSTKEELENFYREVVLGTEELDDIEETGDVITEDDGEPEAVSAPAETVSTPETVSPKAEVNEGGDDQPVLSKEEIADLLDGIELD
jgi:hypothetical protein